MDNIQNNPNLASMYVQQQSEAAEAQGTTGVGKVSSPVTKDQIQAAEQGRIPAQMAGAGLDRPALPAPRGEVPPLPETTGNAWLNSTNMVQFLTVMNEVLKEKLKDTALEGKISVATQEAAIATGFAKAQEILSKGMAQAFQYAVSAVVNFAGAAATGVAAAKQAQTTKEKMEFQKQAELDPTHKMNKEEFAAYNANNTRLTEIEQKIGPPGQNPQAQNLGGNKQDAQQIEKSQQEADLRREQTDLINKQNQLKGDAQKRYDTNANEKQMVLQSGVQMITEITRGADALNQACMQLIVAVHEKEIAEMETEQGAMQRGAESSSKTHASLNDDISNIINSMQEMVRKTNEAFSFRAA